MRIPSDVLERGRYRGGPFGTQTWADFGAFLIDGPCGAKLKILASPGDANDRKLAICLAFRAWKAGEWK